MTEHEIAERNNEQIRRFIANLRRKDKASKLHITGVISQTIKRVPLTSDEEPGFKG